MWWPGLVHIYLSFESRMFYPRWKHIHGFDGLLFMVYLITKIALDAMNRSMKDPLGIVQALETYVGKFLQLTFFSLFYILMRVQLN